MGKGYRKSPSGKNRPKNGLDYVYQLVGLYSQWEEQEQKFSWFAKLRRAISYLDRDERPNDQVQQEVSSLFSEVERRHLESEFTFYLSQAASKSFLRMTFARVRNTNKALAKTAVSGLRDAANALRLWAKLDAESELTAQLVGNPSAAATARARAERKRDRASQYQADACTFEELGNSAREGFSFRSWGIGNIKRSPGRAAKPSRLPIDVNLEWVFLLRERIKGKGIELSPKALALLLRLARVVWAEERHCISSDSLDKGLRRWEERNPELARSFRETVEGPIR